MDDDEEMIRMISKFTDIPVEDARSFYLAGTAELPGIQEVRDLGCAITDAFTNTSPVCEGTDKHVKLVAWSWLAQAIRHANAASLLVDHGYMESIAVHARAAMEHGVYLSLLAALDGDDQLLDYLDQSARQRFNLLVADADEDVPELIVRMMQAAGSEDVDLTTNKWMSIFEQVCGKLDTGANVYRHYRLLSHLSHVGFGSAGPFMMAALGQMGDPDHLVLTHEPLVASSTITMALWLSIGGCAWSGWSVDEIFGTNYFTEVLERAREMDFTPLLLR